MGVGGSKPRVQAPTPRSHTETPRHGFRPVRDRKLDGEPRIKLGTYKRCPVREDEIKNAPTGSETWQP